MATDLVTPQQQNNMAYEWLASNGIDFQGNCSLMHHGNCTISILTKGVHVARVGIKYYISFHLIPFLLRLRKCKDSNQVAKLLGKTAVEYVRSILFITILVTGMKVGLCTSTNQRIGYKDPALISFGFLSGSSILFEPSSRRKEVGCFVMAKALRSVYKSLKRQGYCSIGNQFMVMHVSMMTAIYYIYCHHPQFLKFKNLFEIILGD